MIKRSSITANKVYDQEILFELIDQEYNKYLSAQNSSSKLNHLSTIIHLKSKCSSPSLQSDLYVDVKNFFELYVTTMSERGFEYDVVLQDKIEDKLINLGIKERISVLNFLMRLLKLNHLEDEVKWCQQLLSKQNIIYYILEFNFKNFFLLCFSLSSYNIISLVVSACFILILYAIVLLPFNTQEYVMYEVSYDNYHSNFYINHLLNISSSFFELQDEFKVKPKGVFALVVLMVFKISITAIFLNYLIKEIIKRASLV